MSTADRLSFAVAVLFLWVLALAAVGTVLHSLDVVPSDLSLSLVISLMLLGGVLYHLSLAFVNYYGGFERRLF